MGGMRWRFASEFTRPGASNPFPFPPPVPQLPYPEQKHFTQLRPEKPPYIALFHFLKGDFPSLLKRYTSVFLGHLSLNTYNIVETSLCLAKPRSPDPHPRATNNSARCFTLAEFIAGLRAGVRGRGRWVTGSTMREAGNPSRDSDSTAGWIKVGLRTTTPFTFFPSGFFFFF